MVKKDKYSVDGFSRRPGEIVDTSGEVYVISSDEEDTSNNVAAQLNTLPLNVLEVKRERLIDEMLNLDTSPTAEAVSPITESPNVTQNLGFFTPESVGGRVSASPANNHSNDYIPNLPVCDNTNSQKSESKKVLFSIKSAKKPNIAGQHKSLFGDESPEHDISGIPTPSTTTHSPPTFAAFNPKQPDQSAEMAQHAFNPHHPNPSIQTTEQHSFGEIISHQVLPKRMTPPEQSLAANNVQQADPLILSLQQQQQQQQPPQSLPSQNHVSSTTMPSDLQTPIGQMFPPRFQQFGKNHQQIPVKLQPGMNQQLETSFAGNFTPSASHQYPPSPMNYPTPNYNSARFDYQQYGENSSHIANTPQHSFLGTPLRGFNDQFDGSSMSSYNPDDLKEMINLAVKKAVDEKEKEFEERFKKCRCSKEKCQPRHDSDKKHSDKRRSGSHKKRSSNEHEKKSSSKRSKLNTHGSSTSSEVKEERIRNATTVTKYDYDSTSSSSTPFTPLIHSARSPNAYISEAASSESSASKGPIKLKINLNTKTCKRYGNDEDRGKNIDKNCFFSSDLAETCPICFGRYKRMVSHFKTYHPNVEVFVSRISQSMLNNIKDNTLVRKKINYNVKMTCIFCEEEKQFPSQYWYDHIRSHTGEYANECHLCLKTVSFYNHCGMPTKKLHDFCLNVDDLTAFVCTTCNFLQIDEQNMVAHLRNEHEFDTVEGMYEEIVLIPAFRRPWNSDHRKKQDNAQPAAPRPVVQVLENRLIVPSGYGAHANLGNMFEFEMQTGGENLHCNDFYDQYVVAGENPVMNIDEPQEQNLYKFDEAEEKKLLLADNSETGVWEYPVRPWIEGDYAMKLNVHPLTLFSLYKCMYDKCMFVANNEDTWNKHMQVHINLIDALDKNNMLTKERRDDHIRFRECPYCAFLSKSGFQMNAHMESEHGASCFQCKYCFYRSIEFDNMVLHHQSCHIKKDNDIYITCDQRNFSESELEMMTSYLSERFMGKKTLQCGQGDCEETFGIYSCLAEHLKEVHPDFETNKYTCPHCLEMVIIDQFAIQEHMQNRHGFGEFECIYCNESFNCVDAMRKHMSKNHISKFHFVGVRRFSKNICDSSQVAEDEDEFDIVYIGNDHSETRMKQVKCTNLEACLQLLNAAEMEPDKQRNSLQNTAHELRLQTYVSTLPAITYNGVEPNFFISYNDYLKLKQENSIKVTDMVTKPVPFTSPTIQKPPETEATSAFFVIEPKIYDALNNIPELSYKSQLCPECSLFIPDLKGLFDHLTCGGSKCSTKFEKLYEIFERFTYSPKTQMTYLESSDRSVYKLIKCELQCAQSDCGKRFEKRLDMYNHHMTCHIKRLMISKIMKNVTAEFNITENKSMKSSQVLETASSFHHMFCCAICDKSKPLTKQAIIDHFNVFHSKTALNLLLRCVYNPIHNSLKTDMLDLYVFQCLHCSAFFDSAENVQNHTKDIPNAFYIMQKLLACAEDSTVTNHDNLAEYYRTKFPNAVYTATSIIHRKHCGLCNLYFNHKDELRQHFRVHQNYDLFGRGIMRALGADANEVDIAQCQFVPGCCFGVKRMFNNLTDAVKHEAKCKRRLKCKLCCEIFEDLYTFILHRLKNHDERKDDVCNELKNIKNIFPLLDDLRIVLPNRLVVTKKSIEPYRQLFDTFTFATSIDEVMQQEKSEIDLMVVGIGLQL